MDNKMNGQRCCVACGFTLAPLDAINFAWLAVPETLFGTDQCHNPDCELSPAQGGKQPVEMPMRALDIPSVYLRSEPELTEALDELGRCPRCRYQFVILTDQMSWAFDGPVPDTLIGTLACLNRTCKAFAGTKPSSP